MTARMTNRLGAVTLGFAALLAACSDSTKTPRLYVNLIWHQHQPVYTDPVGDFARGPWVRKHAVKDYYDMAATVAKYPKVHVSINLTPVLLMQLDRFYLQRLKDYVDLASDTMSDAQAATFLASNGGHVVTDPWLDMLVQPTPDPATMTDQQKSYFWRDIWSTFSISDVQIGRFPEYKALRDMEDAVSGTGQDPAYTRSDLRKMKIYFELAWFDPDFLRGPVTLPDGQVVNLSDLVTENADGTFTPKVDFGDLANEGTPQDLGRRLVVEDYKVMANVVPQHAEIAYDPATKKGQVEVMTTPYYHPILPLITDTDLALEAMPTTTMPQSRFQHPEDADAHVKKAVKLYHGQFGHDPTGVWPAEGSVAEDVVGTFARNGIRWIATDRGVLDRSTPAGGSSLSAYRVTSSEGDLAIVFRDTSLSDAVGFQYQGNAAADNVAEFMKAISGNLPPVGEERILSVILDGENAWGSYSKDNDAKGFLNGIYAALEAEYDRGDIVTTTMSEYLDGNPARHVAAHPVSQLTELTHLWAGSWIGGSFATWIGEQEENDAWDYLAHVRNDLATWATDNGLAQPDPMADPPAAGTAERHWYDAWEAMYAAEGSDWFWWYGTDQTADGGDIPFDQEFVALLRAVYTNAQLAGIPGVTVPNLPGIIHVCNAPKAPLTAAPTVDGVFVPDNGDDPTLPNEWTADGAGICQDVDGAFGSAANNVLGTYYWGYTGMTSTDSLFVAVHFDEDVSTSSDLDVRMYFSQKHIDPTTGDLSQDPSLAVTRSGDPIVFSVGGAARELSFGMNGTTVTPAIATVTGGAWGAPVASASIAAVASGRVLEVEIPLSELGYLGTESDLDPLEMLITAVAGGVEVDREPNANSVVVFKDRSTMVQVTFVLDATGSTLALNAVNAGMLNAPPPNGTSTVFIVGNQDDLAQWKPNSVRMYDDGTHGDRVAGDNLWTFQLLVPPQTDVQYKYTIGNAGDGWSATEEFPLTNRAFTAADVDHNRKMEIHDIFADRPNPSGTLAPMTQVTDP